MIGRVRESRNPKKVIRVTLMESYGEIGRVPVNLSLNKLKELACNGYLTISEDSIIPTIEGAILADDIIREFYLPKNSKMMLGHVRRD